MCHGAETLPVALERKDCLEAATHHAWSDERASAELAAGILLSKQTIGLQAIRHACKQTAFLQADDR